MKTSALKKQDGKFVIENRRGEVVRTLDWQGIKLHIIYRHDTRRIETIDDLKAFEKLDIPFTYIEEVRKSSVQKSPVDIGQVGTLRYVENIESLSPSPQTIEDETQPFIQSLKWISGVSTGFLALMFIIAYFIKPEEQEVRIVEIVARPQVEEKKPEPRQSKQPKQKVKQMVVKASNKKVTPRVAKTATVRKVANPTTNKMTVNQMGALGVLGSMSSSKQKGGLNLDAVSTSKGIGRGGNEGSGGMQQSIYGKGLTSAALGEGQRANGAGGYGTKGKGGGQAGYGKLSLVGSSGSFFQPVRSETQVEGGLDRNEIAAVIERHLGEIRYCYEQGLQQSPKLSGRVSMKFFIGAEGYVTSANITNSSLRSNQVEGCITNRLKSWKFPNPRGGVVVKVNYPFVLKRVTDS